MKTDFAQLVDAAINEDVMPEIEENNKAILGVVLCAEGYPKNPMQIKLGKLPQSDKVYIDYASVSGDLSNLQNNSGRILMVISESEDLKRSQTNVYEYLNSLNIPHTFYRYDIGDKALKV